MKKIAIVDSHTGGEPTRTIIAGGPELGNISLIKQRERMQNEFDHYRRAVVCEPRGSDVLVGALLGEPESNDACASVIFFNNVGYLGMCGHGLIGVVTTLAWQNKIQAGFHKIDTPVGQVSVELHADGAVTLRNVPAWRYRSKVPVTLPHGQVIHGDIAWGGNWFFLVEDHHLDLDYQQVDVLTEFAWNIRKTLESKGITGEHGAVIDHIELFSTPNNPHNHSRNFVLCPGKAYDRSPCGTGTSAKLACLAADGKLKAGEVWRQESIIGSVFEARYESIKGSTEIYPILRGRAHINATSEFMINDDDPFAWGI